jgi:hypothetical protein
VVSHEFVARACRVSSRLIRRGGPKLSGCKCGRVRSITMKPARQAGGCVWAVLIGIAVALVGGCGGQSADQVPQPDSMASLAAAGQTDADAVLSVVRPTVAGDAKASCEPPKVFMNAGPIARYTCVVTVYDGAGERVGRFSDHVDCSVRSGSKDIRQRDCFAGATVGNETALPARNGRPVAVCRVGDLRLSTSTQGAGQAGYTAVRVFNVGTRACTLDGFPRVILIARGRRVQATQRSVAGVITADPKVAVVTLAPVPRPSQRRPSPGAAYFVVELGNNCAAPSILAQLEPNAPLRLIRAGGRGPGYCALPGRPPFLTVSQFQTDATASP